MLPDRKEQINTEANMAGTPEVGTGTTQLPVTKGQIVNQSDEETSYAEDGLEKQDGPLQSLVGPIEALGIPDWQILEKKVVRRLDMTLMPMLWILYLFNYLDRSSIAHARLNTFERDIGLVGTQFNTAVAVLTAGYVAAQIPSNMIIGKVRPGIYLPCCAIVWSGVSAATAGVKSFQSLVAVRIILGLVEAPLFPGAIYIMSCWYTRKELALRTAVLYTGLVLAMASSGLIAAGVFHGLDGAAGIAGWQWLFILEAAVGSCFALLAMFLLPDYPSSTTGSAQWTMTEDMRKIAVARIIADRVSTSEAQRSIWFGLRLVLTDYKTWIFVLLNISISAAYGFNNFFPSIVRGFGMGDRTITLLLTAPPYVFAAFVSVFVAWSSDRRKDRGYHICIPVGCAIVGYIICVSTLNIGARYTASFLYVGGLFAANPLVITWAVSTLSKTPEKRAASAAVVNVLGQIGNVMAPYFFPETDEPRYLMAFLLMMGFSGITMLCCVVMKFCLTKENRRLKQRSTDDNTVYNPYTL